ncbi:MAG: tRNA (guanosine(46)-N7)-methyltransferase TrmB [Prevotella sp.]|nr:tRNA (guanosine(46)-N7)-methyltransferase TrmB [Prevotella sp.]
MSKGKLEKFADMATYKNVFQFPFSELKHALDLQTGNDTFRFPLRGHWHDDYFHNSNPIVLELGCGKGEYTVGLARQHPDKNFIGVDIKGARMWTGATEALRDELPNVAFLRTNIEIIDRFFSEGEVDELWLTFSDPQMKNPRKRLTSSFFLERYRRFLKDQGVIHLKTDSAFLFTYTTYVVQRNSLPLDFRTEDLYGPQEEPTSERLAAARSLQTYYEQMWRARGLSIKYMRFHLPQQGLLTEPDIEIDLDDYRSYHRTKRSALDKRK